MGWGVILFLSLIRVDGVYILFFLLVFFLFIEFLVLAQFEASYCYG